MATGASFSLEERTFGQTYAVRILWAALLLVPAALLVWVAIGGTQQPDKTLLGIAAALVLIFISLWVVIGRTRLTINSIGLRHESFFGTREIYWTDIAETRYFVSPISLSGHLGLIGLVVGAFIKSKPVNLTLRVISSERKEIKITSNFRNAKVAIGIVLGRVLPPTVAAVRSRIERGESVQFGPVTLSKTEVVWKTKTVIPVAEVERAELGGSRLRVKRAGKWLDTISIRSDKVPNVLAFLEVLESVAPQLKAIGIDPLARVRF